MSKFSFSWGAVGGDGVSVKMLEDSTLIHSFMEGLSSVRTPVNPSPEAWEEFYRTCKELGVSEWDADYKGDEFVLDGPVWSVDIDRDGLVVKSGGYCEFPPNFPLFCAALEKLVGGLKI